MSHPGWIRQSQLTDTWNQLVRDEVDQSRIDEVSAEINKNVRDLVDAGELTEDNAWMYAVGDAFGGSADA